MDVLPASVIFPESALPLFAEPEGAAVPEPLFPEPPQPAMHPTIRANAAAANVFINFLFIC